MGQKGKAIIIIIIKMIKESSKPVMHNAIAYHTPT